MLKQHEIVITKVGTPCYTSVLDGYDEVALSRTVLGLTRIKTVDPYYLMTFLRCKYGFGQLYRQRELTIQYQLTLPRVKAVDVFLPSDEFQSNVVNLVKQYRSHMHNSIQHYNDALSTLMSKIGSNFSFNKSGISVKTFSKSCASTGRLDAEYYLPKYDDLFSLLNELPAKRLGEIVDIRKSIEPGSEYYGDEGVPFIRVSDVTKMGIDAPSIKIPVTTVPSIEKLYPKKDTILLSKDGSVGIAYKMEDDIDAVTSGALLHLRVKNTKEVIPDYLTLVLNSEVVQLQAERDTNGAIIQHWKPEDIANVIVPILPYDLQSEIARKVQESFSLRRQAEKLIETAVKAVEIAIEQDEAAALEWLNGVKAFITGEGKYESV